METFLRKEVPQVFHEPYIDTGYRDPKSSSFSCLTSLFKPHNELCNIWTHLAPAILVCGLIAWIHLFQIADLFSIDSEAASLGVHFLGVLILLLGSSFAHTFNTMSVLQRHFCFCIDYSAISLFSFSSCILIHGYSFPAELRHGIFWDYYLWIGFTNGVIGTALACCSRLIHRVTVAQRVTLIVGPFAFSYFFCIFPVWYRGFLAATQGDGLISLVANDCTMLYMVGSFLSCTTSVVFYASHIPECWYPSQFDIIGHSHQFFHFFSALGSILQIAASLRDWRYHPKDLWSHVSYSDVLPIFIALVVINSCTVWVFRGLIKRSLAKKQSSNGKPPKGPSSNGLSSNGLSSNGKSSNGKSLNGKSSYKLFLNEKSSNGKSLNGEVRGDGHTAYFSSKRSHEARCKTDGVNGGVTHKEPISAKKEN